jgi:hypothetical protein
MRSSVRNSIGDLPAKPNAKSVLSARMQKTRTVAFQMPPDGLLRVLPQLKFFSLAFVLSIPGDRRIDQNSVVGSSCSFADAHEPRLGFILLVQWICAVETLLNRPRLTYACRRGALALIHRAEPVAASRGQRAPKLSGSEAVTDVLLLA